MEVSARLRGFHDAEGELLSGNGNIDSIVAGDLKEDSRIRTAFIGLSGRVEEARTEAEARSRALLVANGRACALQCLFIRIVHRNVGEQRGVIAFADRAQMRAQVRGQRFVFSCRDCKLPRVLLVGKQLDALIFENGSFGG